MNSFNFSMNSGRENTVAFSSWQGGHHFAPQYRKTGLFAVRAVANADSTLPLYQLMAGSAASVALVGAIALAGAEALVDVVAPDAAGAVAVCWLHPATVNESVNTSR